MMIEKWYFWFLDYNAMSRFTTSDKLRAEAETPSLWYFSMERFRARDIYYISFFFSL